MTLTLTTGCICNQFEVDGIKVMDCDESQLKHLLINATQKIVSKELNDYQKGMLQNILMYMVEDFYDTYESDDCPCECCGDYVETYTMEI